MTTQAEVDKLEAEIAQLRSEIPSMTREQWDAAEKRIAELHKQALAVEERLPA
jgi:ElaB/YqjD/DUF883 family membrane-anchored ribosome-binding protein